jgi:hypothetical protein
MRGTFVEQLAPEVPRERRLLIALLENKNMLSRKDQTTEDAMTRSILAITAALLAVMAVFSSAAKACISCDYIPVVVRPFVTPGVVTNYPDQLNGAEGSHAHVDSAVADEEVQRHEGDVKERVRDK